MCLAAGAAFGNKLPLHTPVTAMGETLSGGRSPIKIMKESTLAGQMLFPKKQSTSTKAVAKAKRSSSKKTLKTTGGGLRINNRKLNTGLQLK